MCAAMTISYLIRLNVRHDAGEVSPNPQPLAASPRHDLTVEDQRPKNVWELDPESSFVNLLADRQTRQTDKKQSVAGIG